MYVQNIGVKTNTDMAKVIFLGYKIVLKLDKISV